MSRLATAGVLLLAVRQLLTERTVRRAIGHLADNIDALSEATADALAARDTDLQRWGTKLVKDIEKAIR